MSIERRLEKRIAVNAAPEQVWEAIATRRGIAAWLGWQEDDTAEGGRCIFGSVTAWEPVRTLAVRGAAAADGTADGFEFHIEPDGGSGTRLRFVHIGFRGENWKAMYEITSKGWDMYFQTLAQYLTHFAGRIATFVATEGPPPSALPGGWSMLLAGLGLGSHTRLGDRVMLQVDGLARIDGVLDYLFPASPAGITSPNLPTFLGVRTADALYRFHGRAVLGATIATGHHLFDDNADIDKTQHAWKTWLEGLFTTG
jgi:uncharacterized protein YndB with AHSA1/START domain